MPIVAKRFNRMDRWLHSNLAGQGLFNSPASAAIKRSLVGSVKVYNEYYYKASCISVWNSASLLNMTTSL